MKQSTPKPLNDGSVIQRRYSVDELRDLWRFCSRDFERFLALLVWIDGLEGK